MGERLRRRGKGRSWEARTKEGDAWVWKSTGKLDKDAARAVLRDWERFSADPTYRAEASATLEIILREYLASRMSRGRSEATLKYVRQKSGALVRLLPTYIADVTHATCEHYIGLRKVEKVQQTTIKKELRVLKAALVLARRNGKLTRDPDAIVPELEDTSKAKERYLTPNEFLGLILGLPEERAAHVVWLVATAARWGESTRARREDHDETQIRIRGTKTKASKRTIPILPTTRPLLVWALARAGFTTLFAKWGNVRRDLHQVCERLGIPPVSPNDLRRTHATWLRQAGVEPHLIGAALGHRDGRMAERVYGRLGTAELGALLTARVQVPPGSHAVAESGVLSRRRGKKDRKKPAKIVPRDRIELSTRGFSIPRTMQDSAANAAISPPQVPPRPHGKRAKTFYGGMVVQ